MSLIISTGCPDSGWDIAVPVLLELGFETADDKLIHWHDDVFQELGSDKSFESYKSLSPGKSLIKKLTQLTPESKSRTILLAESRTLRILDFWATHFNTASFILFFTSPQTALACAVNKGLDPLRFLHEWRNANQLLIQFQTRHRLRAIFLDAEVAGQYPQKLAEVCGKIGIEVKCDKNIQPATQIYNELQPLEYLLVNNLAAGTPLQELYLELQTRAHPLGDVETHLAQDPEQLFHKYQLQKNSESQLKQQIDTYRQELENQKKLAADKHDIESENELLLLQLHQVQEELEHYFIRNNELESEKESVIREKERTSQELISQNMRAIQERDQNYRKQISIKEQEFQAREYTLRESMQQKVRALQARGKVIEDYKTYLSAINNSLCRRMKKPLTAIVNYGKRLFKDKEIRAQMKVLLGSGLFDEQWYLVNYPDVAKNNIDPLEHYLLHGADERRNPSKLFDTRYYMQKYPDVVNSGLNPLIHYVKHGINEGRKVVKE